MKTITYTLVSPGLALFVLVAGARETPSKQDEGILRLAAAQVKEAEFENGERTSVRKEVQNDKPQRSVLEEIFVTAQKREERTIDIPMSITAISGEDLAKGAISSMLDLSRAVPSLAISESGPGRQNISIRGFGSARGSSSLIGVYLDEMPVSGAQNGFYASYSDLRVIDLNRVEVLKGPQGTLFGEGSAGGVIRFITNDPDLGRLGGDISTEFSNTADGGLSEKVTGTANVPLAEDMFGIRVAAVYENTSGWIDQPSIGRTDINDGEVVHVRGKALYTPTPELQIKGLVEIHRSEGGGSNIVNQKPLEDSNFLQAFDRSAPTDYVDDYEAYNLAATYDFGFAELLSSTSYVAGDSRQSFTQLVDGEPVPWTEILLREFILDSAITSQELRLTSATEGPFVWTFGATYKDTEVTWDTGYGVDAVIFGGAAVFAGAGTGGFASKNKSEGWAGFGDLSYRLTDRLDLGGGLRYFREDREIITPTFSASTNPDKLTWRVYGKFEAWKDVNLYFNVGTGFRSGGLNDPLVVPRGGQATYSEEDSTFYELGTKMSLFNGRLRFDAALYYGEWENMQDDIVLFSAVDGEFLQFTGNGQDAEMKGVEWEISWLATDRLMLTLAGNVIDSEITWVDPANLNPTYFLGDPINSTPDYSLSAGAEYSFQWSAAVQGFALVNFTRQGEATDTARNFVLAREGERQIVHPELNFLSASIGAEWSGWKASLFGRNLLDERDPVSPGAFGILGVWPQARPRTVGVTISKTF